MLVPGAKPSGHVKFASAMSTITGSTRILGGILMVGNHGRYDKGPQFDEGKLLKCITSFGMEGGKWKVEGFHCLPKSTRRINTALKH